MLTTKFGSSNYVFGSGNYVFVVSTKYLVTTTKKKLSEPKFYLIIFFKFIFLF